MGIQSIPPSPPAPYITEADEVDSDVSNQTPYQQLAVPQTEAPQSQKSDSCMGDLMSVFKTVVSLAAPIIKSASL